MRDLFAALVLGAFVGAVNHVAVFSGMLGAPPGFAPAYVIRNLDIPQYLTWAALAKDYWLLPNFHAPWQTEPALFQPMLQIVGKSGLAPLTAYYLLQGLLYWITAFALIQAFRTFCRSRREMMYAAIVMIGALPLKLVGWAVAKWVGAAAPVQMGLAYGLIEYSYETADGFLRGGLSNSFTLTFGTAITLFSFTALAKYLRTGDRVQFRWLCACAFVGALFHPFEVFLVVAGAVFPLWSKRRAVDAVVLGVTGMAGVLPYLVQVVRSPWLRDASDLAQWQMTSPAWVILAFGLPALLICWLMAMRFRGESSDDDVLQSWFLTTALLPMVPAVPVAIHLFDGFTYCLGFLLVRKASQDKLFRRFGGRMRPLAWGWAGVSLAVLATAYAQIFADGRKVEPELGRPAIIASDERRMLEWMGLHLRRDQVVLAPLEMAPWVATIPMIAMASHDVFSVSFDAQREAATRFFAGDSSVLDRYGVRYVVSEKSLPMGELRHRQGNLWLYELPESPLRPYVPVESSRRNGFRRWLFGFLGAK